MTLDEMKADLLAVLDYRSGPDSCNSIYVGSMASAQIYHAFRMRYGYGDIREAIRGGSLRQVEQAYEVAKHTIAYMKAHPRQTCPCCGTVGVQIRTDWEPLLKQG